MTDKIDALFEQQYGPPPSIDGTSAYANYALALADFRAGYTARDEEVRILRETLDLALEYWKHKQQRYKNRHPVWVEKAIATAKEST